MKINPFKLERYFAKHEFEEKLLCCSDCDGVSMRELLNLADNECLYLWENLKLGYTKAKGSLLLREEIAKLYSGISPEDILICNPEEGIFIAMNCLIQYTGYPRDYVICPYPSYQSLSEILLSLKANVYYWIAKKENNWQFDVDDLVYSFSKKKLLSRGFDRRLGAKIKLIVNFSHNPTGYLPSKDDFLKIIEIVRENNDYIFSDEMYRFLEYDEKDRLPSACEVYDKATSLFGMSKTFGMAGVRIGWLITKDRELMKKFEMFKDYTTICSSAPSEILSVIALRNKDTIIKRNLEVIKNNLEYLDDFFHEYSEFFSWVRLKAGTVCFPKLLTDEDSYKFCERVRKEAGILLLPSSVYNFDDRHFRIGFGRKNMPEVLSLFKDYLDKKDLRNFF